MPQLDIFNYSYIFPIFVIFFFLFIFFSINFYNQNILFITKKKFTKETKIYNETIKSYFELKLNVFDNSFNNFFYIIFR